MRELDGAFIHPTALVVGDVLLGEGASLWPQAVVRGNRVGQGCLIGMGAMLLSGSDIGEECIIAAGAIVTEGKKIPPRSLVMGIPGKVVRQVTDAEIEHVKTICKRYRDLAIRYSQGDFKAW